MAMFSALFPVVCIAKAEWIDAPHQPNGWKETSVIQPIFFLKKTPEQLIYRKAGYD